MEARNSITSYNPTDDFASQAWVEKISLSVASTQAIMREGLGWIFSLGIETSMPFYQRFNLALMNRIAFASLLLSFPGTFLLMLLGFTHPYSQLMGGMLVACLVLGLNAARRVEWSKTLFAFSPAVLMVIFTFLELNTVGAEHALLLILSRQGLGFALLLPILIYGFEDRQKVLGIAGLCVLTLLIYEVGSMRLGAFENEEIFGLAHGLFASLSLIQYVTLAGCILYMQHFTLQQEQNVKKATEKLQRQAIHDGQTGLFNHAFMEGLVGDAINRTRRSNTPLSLLMIDADHFKHINDNLGHNAGDEALKQLINVLSGNKRSTDYLGRWGGDELVMLLTETDLPGAAKLAEKLRQRVEAHTFLRDMHLTISLGASQYHEGDTPVSFVERADAAMYRAKRGGRNKVEVQRPANSN